MTRRNRPPAAVGFAQQLRANLSRGPLFESEIPGHPGPVNHSPRLIAFYLPQFHPIPENDHWWGEGFTEWTNVTRGLPQFPGHYQPRLPGALGFYDLRMPEALRAQAKLARRYGLHGFCLHYYWFGGRRLLDAPLKLLLANPDIDLPFCLCWANENWTRRWDGLEQDVLIAQKYSPQDDIEFIRSLEPALRDPRYIRIGGRPLLILYRPTLLPDALATGRRWRVHCARVGINEPYIAMVQCFGDEDPRPYGFDAAVEFPPHKLGFLAPRRDQVALFDPASRTIVSEYDAMIRNAAAAATPPYKLFRGVCPSWDNEARKPGRGHVFAGATPARYEDWLRDACNSASSAADPDERLVFINAWNEWAEGAHLEPDRHLGHAYLNATARVLNALAPNARRIPHRRVVVVSHDAHPHGAQYLALNLVRELVLLGVQVHVLLGGPGALEASFAACAPTERIEREFDDPAAWLAVGAKLHAQGFRVALCNTTVAAQAIPPLREAGLSVISLVHELPSFIANRHLEPAARVAAREADALVFPSAIVKNGFTSVAGRIANRAIIRPQGLYLTPAPRSDRDRLRKAARLALNAAPSDRILLGCGYGDHRKGFDLWPDLIIAAYARCPEALFVWAGRVEDELKSRVLAELEAAGLASRLRLVGHVDDLRPFYCSADVFLLTSREDPFPSVVLEALAHGVPTIAFAESGGSTDLIAEVGGPLVPMADTSSMAAAVCRLLRDEPARSAISAAAARRLEQGFSYSEYASALLAIAHPAVLTVSVVVPNYNYARYLRHRIRSIREQTYPVQEIILLDDASTDESAAVISELERTFPDLIRVERNEANSGSVARQWARGVALASGDLVWIAEADDFAESTFLETLVPAFADPDVVLSYCESRQIDAEGRVLADNYLTYVADIDPARWRADYHREGVSEIAEALSVKNTIPNVSAALFRRDAIARVLRDNLEEMTLLRNTADWCCYIRLLTQGSIAFRHEPLNHHRRHGGSVTIANNDTRHFQEIGMMQQLCTAVVNVPPEYQKLAARWRAQVARQFNIELSTPATGADVFGP